MRWIVAVLLVIVLAVGALWATGIVSLGPKEPVVPDLFAVLEDGDATAVTTALAEGANLNVRNSAGLTPLMAAVSANAPTPVLDALLAAGAAVNEQAANGATALTLAAEHGGPTQLIYLLNAGADPTLPNAEGHTAIDLAAGNRQLIGSGVESRLSEFQTVPFVVGWPSAYMVPVEGATISSRRNHLPGAPRPYRNGVHEGFDFYNGTVSVNIAYGTPINAVADGVIIRADHDYQDPSQVEYDAMIAEAARSLDTPAEILDALRGRQVWIRHAGGFVSRYAHLAAVAEVAQEGTVVRQGDIIGTTGNSGTVEAVQGTQDDPHPHVEVWSAAGFLGSGLEPEETWTLAAQVFGQAALPPFHD